MFEIQLFEWNVLKHDLETDPDPYWALLRFFDNVEYNDSGINPWAIDSWPDQWTLLKSNNFDSFTIPLSMVYVLSTVHRFDDLVLELWIASLNSEKYYFAIIDNYIINFNEKVIPIKDLDASFIIERIYSWDFSVPRKVSVLKEW